MLCLVVTEPGPRVSVGKVQDQNAPLTAVPRAIGQARAIGAKGRLARLPDDDVSRSAGELDNMDVKGLPVGIGIIDGEVDPSSQGRSGGGQWPPGARGGGCLTGSG